MGPRHVVGERLEEQPRGERSPVTTGAHILEIRDFRVEHLAVLGGKRERPDRLTDPVGCGLHLIDPLATVAHDAGDLLTQRHHARSRERREIDDRIGPL